MPRPSDLARLFEHRRRWTGPYGDLGTELDAVRARKKPISMFSMTRGGIERDEAFFIELVKEAFNRGLTVILDPDGPSTASRRYAGVEAYVSHRDQVWRVPAMRALRQTAFIDGAWSDAADEQTGVLLGYTPKQRAAWRAKNRWDDVAWGALTMYTLLTRAHSREVVELGQRCFGPPSVLEGMTFFWHSSGKVRRDAARLTPAGFTLARVGVERDVFRTLFRPSSSGTRPGIKVATISKAMAARLAGALRSNVEFLAGTRWK